MLRLRSGRARGVSFVMAVAAASCCIGGLSSAASARGSAASATSCATAKLSKPPRHPLELKIGGATGSLPYAALFLMAGAAPKSVRPHAGKWYNVDFVPFTDPSQRVIAFQAGQINAFASAAPAFLQYVSQGVKVQDVASLGKLSNSLASTLEPLVTSANGPIKSISDLAGKTIATTGLGTMSQLSAQLTLSADGVSPSSVKFVSLSAADTVAAVENGTVDAAYGSQPFVGQGLQSGQLRVIATENTGLHALFGAQSLEFLNLMVGDSVLNQDPLEVCAFLDDLHSSVKWLTSHTKQGITAFVNDKYLAVSLQEALASKLYIYGAPIPVGFYTGLLPYAKQFGYLPQGTSNAALLKKALWAPALAASK